MVLEFAEERKLLLETVGPSLQSVYDDMGIEVSNDQKRKLFHGVFKLLRSQ